LKAAGDSLPKQLVNRWPNNVNMARAEGLEPSAYGFGDRRSTT
jgi:hypothetical protein